METDLPNREAAFPWLTLSDCFVVAGEKQLRHAEAWRLGSLEIDHQLHECLARKPKEKDDGQGGI
jgi:hypothetical protein